MSPKEEAAYMALIRLYTRVYDRMNGHISRKTDASAKYYYNAKIEELNYVANQLSDIIEDLKENYTNAAS